MISPLVTSPLRRSVRYGWDKRVYGSTWPPLKDDLVVYLTGANEDATHKRDKVNGYHFRFDNCPGDYEYSDGSLDESDGTSDWDGESYITSGWGCTYYAPAAGEPGHAEVLAMDDGTFYDGSGNPRPMVLADLTDLSGPVWYFCEKRGLYGYDHALDASEDAAAESFCL